MKLNFWSGVKTYRQKLIAFLFSLPQVNDWTNESGNILKDLAKEYNFFLMEDRKFFDIGNTVKHQVQTIFRHQ